MLRNGRLLHLQSIHNLPHRPLLQRQIVEYLSPPRLGNSIESVRSRSSSCHNQHNTFRHGNMSSSYYSSEKAVCQSHLLFSSCEIPQIFSESPQSLFAAFDRSEFFDHQIPRLSRIEHHANGDFGLVPFYFKCPCRMEIRAWTSLFSSAM